MVTTEHCGSLFIRVFNFQFPARPAARRFCSLPDVLGQPCSEPPQLPTGITAPNEQAISRFSSRTPSPLHHRRTFSTRTPAFIECAYPIREDGIASAKTFSEGTDQLSVPPVTLSSEAF
jgi:hypothetical protein